MFCQICGRQQNDGIFCTNCGVKLFRLPTFTVPSFNQSDKELILHYHKTGLRYKSIVLLLEKYHGIEVSIRTLKRRLNEYGVSRKIHTKDAVVRSIITRELIGPASQFGYRNMWCLLKTSYGVYVPRDTVAQLLRELDPEGVAERANKKFRRRCYRSLGKFS